MLYQIGWSTLPGLRGISCSDFRAAPTDTPGHQRGVAIEVGDETRLELLLQELEAHFSTMRFTNAADAFDTVKAFVLEEGAKFS